MADADTRDRLIQCFAAVFAQLDEREIPCATKFSVGTWDSLANFSLMAVIEEEFGVRIEPEDLDLFVSFELILDYLENKSRVS
ncbi:MAG: acyl carrier protein [Isosphaeraceae bacterium]